MSTRTSVPALEKGLRILEYFSNSVESKTLTQIARELHYKVSEIHRTLNYLESSSYIIRNSVGAYFLGSKLYRIAFQAMPQKYLLRRAIVPMERFVQVTGESIHISILIEAQISVIGQIEGTGVSRLSIRLGSYPAYKSTSGILLLAFREDFDLDYYDITSEEKFSLKKELVKNKKQGYGFHDSYYTEGTYDLAVPIFLDGIGTVAAIATSFLKPKSNTKLSELKNRYLSELLKCADQIKRNFEKPIVSTNK
jgi:DNA-binding IclR family transcriptional regulator